LDKVQSRSPSVDIADREPLSDASDEECDAEGLSTGVTTWRAVADHEPELGFRGDLWHGQTMEREQEQIAESGSFEAALAENICFLLQSLEVVAVESLSSGDRTSAGFFFNVASLVRYFARTEGLAIEQDTTSVRTSELNWSLG
jgi:hypothetical protein